MAISFKHLYPDGYFKSRDLQDENRLRSFLLEKEFIKKYIWGGRVCDVGCSTGEFLEYISWDGERYGMEISDYAKQKAEEKGIQFNKDITNVENFFDMVVFRGTIQHLPYPFLYIERAFHALKDKGFVAFLATPNANSIYYKLFNTLPMLNSAMNFYIPSDITLSNVLKNTGFKIIEIEYPYLKSPYCHPVGDHLKFIKKFLLKTEDKFSFWKNSMNIIAQKV